MNTLRPLLSRTIQLSKTNVLKSSLNKSCLRSYKHKFNMVNNKFNIPFVISRSYSSRSTLDDSIPRKFAGNLYEGIRFYGEYPLIIDVRDKVSYSIFRIMGTHNVPYLECTEEVLKTLPHDREIVVFGSSERNEEVVDIARRIMSLGYNEVSIIEGGPREFVDNNFMYYFDYDTYETAVENLHEVDEWIKEFMKKNPSMFEEK